MENARRFEIQARHSVIPERKVFPIQRNVSSLSLYFPAQVTVCKFNHMISSPSGLIGFPELLRLSHLARGCPSARSGGSYNLVNLKFDNRNFSACCVTQMSLSGGFPSACTPPNSRLRQGVFPRGSNRHKYLDWVQIMDGGWMQEATTISGASLLLKYTKYQLHTIQCNTGLSMMDVNRFNVTFSAVITLLPVKAAHRHLRPTQLGHYYRLENLSKSPPTPPAAPAGHWDPDFSRWVSIVTSTLTVSNPWTEH